MNSGTTVIVAEETPAALVRLTSTAVCADSGRAKAPSAIVTQVVPPSVDYSSVTGSAEPSVPCVTVKAI